MRKPIIGNLTAKDLGKAAFAIAFGVNVGKHISHDLCKLADKVNCQLLIRGMKKLYSMMDDEELKNAFVNGMFKQGLQVDTIEEITGLEFEEDTQE